MANLLGQDIGLNYKGLINIGSTINQNISASLQSLTDGDGNLLPLQISTTQISVGGATGTGRLIVRGDGTNSTTRFENSAGTVQFAIDNLGRTQIGEYQPYPAKLALGGSDATFVIARTNGDSSIIFNASATEIGQIRSISGTGLRLQTTPANTSAVLQGSVTTGAVYANRFTNSGNFTATSGEQGLANIAATFAAAAGSANFRPLSINYTINNSGAQTGTMTGIFLNATETALNGMTHNLMDLQVGGVSRFRIPSGVSASVLAASLNITSNTANSVALIVTGVSNNGGMLVRGSNFYTFRAQSAASVDCFTIGTDGNTIIGPAIGATARLGVRGDGTNPIARFEDNAGTAILSIANNGVSTYTGTFNITGALTQTSPGTITAGNAFGFSSSNGNISAASLITMTMGANGTIYIARANNITSTSGQVDWLGFNNGGTVRSFSPTSGTATMNGIYLGLSINQTGGANGITRGLYIEPTLTSAVDFRGVEVKAGSTSAHDLILLTNAAGNKVFEVNAAQQIGLFGVTPIAQPTTAITGATVTSGSGAPILEDDTFAGFTVAQVIQALVNLGILKP